MNEQLELIDETLADKIRKALRPSGAARWMTCAASAAREAPYPNTSSEYAQEGTAAHAVAAAALVSTGDAGELIGQHLEGVLVDRDMATHVQRYVDYVAEFRGLGWDAVEERLSFSGVLPVSGTVDFAAVVDATRTLHIVDLKFGRGVKVYAYQNEQLMLYALGVLNDYRAFIDVDTVELHIAQPRLDHFDRWQIPLDDLRQFQTEVQAAVFRAQEPDAPADPGRHCKFCKAQGNCRELAEWNMRKVSAEFEDLTTKPVPPFVGDLTPEEVSALLTHAPAIRSFLDAVATRAAADIREGREVPGWKLVTGRSSRKWLDGEAVAAHAKAKRIPIDVYLPRELASVAQLEKALTPKEFNKKGFATLMEKGEGAPTLAPADDKRPALTFAAAASDFDDLTAQDPALDAALA